MPDIVGLVKKVTTSPVTANTQYSWIKEDLADPGLYRVNAALTSIGNRLNQLETGSVAASVVKPGGGGNTTVGVAVYTRTLDINNSTTGVDIAPRVTIFISGTALRFTGVLRLPIVADLTVRVNLNGVAMTTLVIPYTTPISTVLATTRFTVNPQQVSRGDVLSWDITTSDGQRDSDGVASFTLEWQ